MKISLNMQKAINNQIKNEFDNAFLYLAISAWFTEKNLLGFANWNYVQYQEEQTHAIKFYNYILDRQGSVTINAIEKPKINYKNPLEIFKDILKREQETTEAIYALYRIAQEEDDYTSLGFLKWYLDEQIEEESNALQIIEDLNLIGDCGSSLMILDKKLSKREFKDETK